MTAGGNATFGALPTTVFEVMSRLAAECNSINLGQGFPDDQLEGPAEMKDVVHRWVGGWRRRGGAGSCTIGTVPPLVSGIASL